MFFNGSSRRARQADRQTNTQTDATKRIISPASRSIKWWCYCCQIVFLTTLIFFSITENQSQTDMKLLYVIWRMYACFWLYMYYVENRQKKVGLRVNDLWSNVNGTRLISIWRFQSYRLEHTDQNVTSYPEIRTLIPFVKCSCPPLPVPCIDPAL